jgi:hypothetical protein
MKPFRIFRPGKHTASCGTATEFTKDDLAKAVEAYNVQLYAAPLVIGHPKVEDRAYGWAEKLTMDDAGDVWAHPEKVEPKFGDLVEQGAYRNRSASWYMPDHPNNPVPGVLYPKHIGFLGAVPPALKGLGDVEFCDGQPLDFKEEHPDKVVEFTAADDAWSLASLLSSTARLFRGLRDAMLADKGAEEADKLLPSWQIEDLERQALRQEERARNTQDPVLFAEPANPTPKEPAMTLTPEQIADLEKRAREGDEAKARVASFQEREAAIAAAEHLATVDAIDRSLEPLVKAGKVLPANRKHLAQFMASLADGDDAKTIEFGEAPEGGQVPKVSPRQFMREFLGKLPKAVDYSERGNTSPDNTGALTPAQLAEKATKLRADAALEGRHMSFTEATNRVLEESGVSVENPSEVAQV